MDSLNRDVVYRGLLANVDYVAAGEEDGKRYVMVGKINTSVPVGTVVSGAVGWKMLDGQETVELGKQGVEKTVSTTAAKEQTTRHLSDNAKDIGIAEIGAGH